MATEDFGKLVRQAQDGDAEAMEQLLKEYGDAIQREIRFCLLDQQLRRVVSESDVFQSVIACFALKLRDGRYEFDTPGDLIGLLKVMARAHVAHVARFWHAKRRDLRRNTGMHAIGVIGVPDRDPVVGNAESDAELLKLAMKHMPERDRQIFDWRQDNVTWPEIARRLNVPSPEALRKQYERHLACLANAINPVELDTTSGLANRLHV